MYEKTNSYSIIFDFIKNNTYRNIPVELWDNRLWLYGSILEKLDNVFQDKTSDNITLYVNVRECKTAGVACLIKKENTDELLIDAVDYMDIDKFIENIVNGYTKPLKITVNSLSLANCIQEKLKYDFKGDFANYYATRNNYIESKMVIKELMKGDGYLFGGIGDLKGWTDLDRILDNGIRYFSIVENNHWISMCGIGFLSVFRAEIIAVMTLEPYRKKGLAKEVCSFAMKEVLKVVPLATWTARVNNEVSCATAESLGFTKYNELYNFSIDKT